MPIDQNLDLEVRRGTSFSAYVLHSDDMFSQSDYKLLNGQRNSGLLMCLCSRYNGMRKLTYFSDDLIPLRSCLPDISPEQFVVVMASIASEIIKVQHNGFLSSGKLDLDIDAIYINTQTCAASLIYLPIKENVSGSDSTKLFNYYCQLMFYIMGQYAQLKPLIRTVAGFANSSLGRFDVLINHLDSAFAIGERALNEYAAQQQRKDVSSRTGSNIRNVPSVESYAKRVNKLVGMAEGRMIQIDLTQGKTVIGKSRLSASFVIEGAPTISNRHCEIEVADAGAIVRDLGSTNGTYVNGMRLGRGQAAKLDVGDILKLASIEFEVRGA